MYMFHELLDLLVMPQRGPALFINFQQGANQPNEFVQPALLVLR